MKERRRKKEEELSTINTNDFARANEMIPKEKVKERVNGSTNIDDFGGMNHPICR